MRTQLTLLYAIWKKCWALAPLVPKGWGKGLVQITGAQKGAQDLTMLYLSFFCLCRYYHYLSIVPINLLKLRLSHSATESHFQRTRVVPKVMSNNFLHANWEQQTKESTVVDETSCCVILECLVTSMTCIT